MLSLETLKELEALQERSHEAYPEGGLLYTYVEAANQAHCRFKCVTPRENLSHVPEDVLKELARLLQVSQGEYGLEKADPPFIQQASDLMDKLRTDVSFGEVYISFEDKGTDMEAIIHMARRTDNRYFSLELWWSID